MTQVTTEVLESQPDVTPAEAEDAHQAGPTSVGPESADQMNEQSGAKLVPVTESIRYRKRAQQAEQQLHDLQSQYQRLQGQLELARQTIDAVERRQKIDQMLVESDPVDLEAARLLTELAVEQMEDPDIAQAVEELRQRKPYLFRKRSGAGASLSPRPRSEAAAMLDDAAEQATETGDRRDLLRYLRLRRRSAASG